MSLLLLVRSYKWTSIDKRKMEEKNNGGTPVCRETRHRKHPLFENLAILVVRYGWYDFVGEKWFDIEHITIGTGSGKLQWDVLTICQTRNVFFETRTLFRAQIKCRMSSWTHSMDNIDTSFSNYQLCHANIPKFEACPCLTSSKCACRVRPLHIASH